jgi:hypothetical protein
LTIAESLERVRVEIDQVHGSEALCEPRQIQIGTVTDTEHQQAATSSGRVDQLHQPRAVGSELLGAIRMPRVHVGQERDGALVARARDAVLELVPR